MFPLERPHDTASLIKGVSHNGYVADWVGYRGTGPDKGLFVIDPVKGETGSYDAIRTSFQVSGAADLARINADFDAMAEALQLFGKGASWGGFESLALPITPHTYRSVMPCPCAGRSASTAPARCCAASV